MQERPLGLSVLASVQALAGSLALVYYGTALFAIAASWLPGFSLSESPPSAWLAFFVPEAVGLVLVVVAAGIWQMRPWAWRFALLTQGGFSLLGIHEMAFGAQGFGVAISIFAGGSLVYLLATDVRADFERAQTEDWSPYRVEIPSMAHRLGNVLAIGACAELGAVASAPLVIVVFGLAFMDNPSATPQLAVALVPAVWLTFLAVQQLRFWRGMDSDRPQVWWIGQSIVAALALGIVLGLVGLLFVAAAVACEFVLQQEDVQVALGR
jgi:hypothetical protein